MALSLGKKVILLCDGFLPHREWLSIVGEKSHGYDGGEGYVGPAGITHLWQPVDVGVARQFKCRFREKADVYRMKNSTTCLSVSEIITLANEAWNSITREQVISYWVRSGYVTANGVRSASEHTWVGSDHGSTVNPDDEPLYNPLDADQPEFLGDVPVDDYSDSASEEEGSEASDSSDSDSSSVSSDEEEFPVRGARKEQTAVEEPYPIPTMRQPLEPDMVKWLEKNKFIRFRPQFEDNGLFTANMLHYLLSFDTETNKLMVRLFGDNTLIHLHARRAIDANWQYPKEGRKK